MLKQKIESYKSELNNTIGKIREDLKDYFEGCDYDVENKDVQIVSVNTLSDLDKLYSSPGFYVILTDRVFNDNKCRFTYNNQTAIYRGHSYHTKKRVMSHLFNEIYKAERKESELNYTVCLKVEDGINGINLNKSPYCDWNWTVIVHKMRKSSELIREQAELAFDDVFGKPCKSREI